MERNDLHEYQNYCVEFLKTHPEAMLILEMGLGKSAVSLTAILDLMFDSFDVGKVLVIAPLRVAKTVWPEERNTWEHAHFLKMSVMVGTAKQREAALRTPADVYVVNRENVKWLTDYLEKHGIPWPFDMVVIDELSSFKNHQSQRWKALRKVRPQIKRMVGLTGTPASNGLLDLWAETFLIDNGQRLGRFIGRYREAYFKAAGMNPYTGVVFNYVPLPGAEEAIYSRISDISVSMKALEDLYGLDLDYYMQINFTGFEKLIDAIGGITVDVPQGFTNENGGGYTFTTGPNQMNGKKALAFARERYALASGDNERGKNQMRVIEAVINKISSGGATLLLNYADILNSLQGMFVTDMSSEDIAALVKMQLDDGGSWNIKKYAVTGKGGSDYTYSMPNTRAYVMYQNADLVSHASDLVDKVEAGQTLTDADVAEN